MSEFGDCSRILSNFYLQDYDKQMKQLCDETNSRYLRYADDQIIYSQDETSAKKLLFEASKLLFKIGLDINSSKVNTFQSREDFDLYWAFEIFSLIGKGTNKENLNKAIDKFFELKNKGVSFRENSILKKLINVNFNDIEHSQRLKLLRILIDKEFLPLVDHTYLSKLYKNLDEGSKKELIETLRALIDTVNFNAFHFNLKKFFEKNTIEYKEEHLENRIRILRI